MDALLPVLTANAGSLRELHLPYIDEADSYLLGYGTAGFDGLFSIRGAGAAAA